jgi:hypothetical protein
MMQPTGDVVRCEIESWRAPSDIAIMSLRRYNPLLPCHRILTVLSQLLPIPHPANACSGRQRLDPLRLGGTVLDRHGRADV